MLDKILTDEKTFRIFCLILFAIIFFVILKKNKKEKFSELSSENLQAIKNLGELAKKISDTSTGILDMKNVNLKVNNLEVNGRITNNEFTEFKTTATNAKNKAEEAFEKATTITNPPLGTTTSVGVGAQLGVNMGAGVGVR